MWKLHCVCVSIPFCACLNSVQSVAECTHNVNKLSASSSETNPKLIGSTSSPTSRSDLGDVKKALILDRPSGFGCCGDGWVLVSVDGRKYDALASSCSGFSAPSTSRFSSLCCAKAAGVAAEPVPSASSLSLPLPPPPSPSSSSSSAPPCLELWLGDICEAVAPSASLIISRRRASARASSSLGFAVERALLMACWTW